eukprot:g20228.t1
MLFMHTGQTSSSQLENLRREPKKKIGGDFIVVGGLAVALTDVSVERAVAFESPHSLWDLLLRPHQRQ